MSVYLGNSVYNDSQVTPEELKKIDKLKIFEIENPGLVFNGFPNKQDLDTARESGKIIFLHIVENQGTTRDYYIIFSGYAEASGQWSYYFEDVENKREYKYGNYHTPGDPTSIGWNITNWYLDSIEQYSDKPVESSAIYTELTAINDKITGDLNDIFLALASKGVTVPAGAGLDDVAGLITDIPSGGSVDPLPENWVRVTGLKGTWNKSGEPFKFPNLVDTTNENLESTALVYIDPITAAPYASGNQQETQIFCPFASLYFQFFERSGNPTLAIHGKNGGQNRTSDITYGSTTFGGMKTLTYKRNVLYMDGSTFVIDSRVYAQTTVKNLSGLWGKWSSYNENTPCTFFDCTVKDNGNIIAHFIPVMNTVTGEPKLYDEISGTLSESNTTSLINEFEIIP